MIRLRKYRIFLFVSIVSLLVVWFVSRDASWSDGVDGEGFSEITGLKASVPIVSGQDKSTVPAPEAQSVFEVDDTVQPAGAGDDGESSPTVFPQLEIPASGPPAPPANELAGQPEASVSMPDKEIDNAPSQFDTIVDAAAEHAPIAPHTFTWSSRVERFPVPTGSTIQLPTASPKPIPKIQFDFKPDPPSVRNERQVLLNSIRDSMKRTWDGYRRFAWMKDELRPESGGSADKFMGWAATLVDSLDTLWIMGMEREFEEAVAATGEIDFKSSIHQTIPMFETTIRYLGGLLGAYDISGGKYKVLLDKAVELGEILMGAFDTPNRMPILYYPLSMNVMGERASRTACLAELGSLSVEFTRLAQLTKEPRYYDAVARVTNGLEELQNRTSLPGLWPLQIDLSGCKKPDSSSSRHSRGSSSKLQPKPSKPKLNKDTSSLGGVDQAGDRARDDRTAEEMLADVADPSFALDHKSSEKDTADVIAAETLLKEGATSSFATDVEEATKTDDKQGADDLISLKDTSSFGDANGKVTKRQLGGQLSGDTDAEEDFGFKTASPVEDVVSQETCIPSGLDSGSLFSDRFTLGGEADSTYEYLPKV